MKIKAEEIRVLIVEDNESTRNNTVNILLQNGFLDKNIFDTAIATEALEIVNMEFPHVVLLDLKIPYDHIDKPAEIRNAESILNQLKLNKYQLGINSHVIMISGSIKDKQSQGLMKNDLVLDFFDKGEASQDLTKYKTTLLDRIQWAYMKLENEESNVNLMILRKAELKTLAKIHKPLWIKIEKEVLNEFEKLGNKKANHHTISKQIIGSCGEVVEDIIYYFEKDSLELTEMRYSSASSTVRNKLTSLSGRKYINHDSSYEQIGEVFISRRAAEYAYNAFRYRSEALHGKGDDEKLCKLFAGHEFTKDDAALSISLIIPIVKEFIDHKLKSNQ